MGESLLTFDRPLEGSFLAEELEEGERMLGGFHHESREGSKHAIQDLMDFSK